MKANTSEEYQDQEGDMQLISEDLICTKCSKECDDNDPAVLCEFGAHWVHYTCDKLKRKDITQIELSEAAYICLWCVPNSRKRAITTNADTQMLSAHKIASVLQFNDDILIIQARNEIIKKDHNKNPLAVYESERMQV